MYFKLVPGLKSRFNTFIEFGDFSEPELNAMLASMCKKNNYELDKAAARHHKVAPLGLSENKEEQYANGRLVRNIFNDFVMNHARRVAKIDSTTRYQLMEITMDDIHASILKTNAKSAEE